VYFCKIQQQEKSNMKRIITMAALAATLLTAQAQTDPYKARMDSLEKQSMALYQEYKSLMKAEAEKTTDAGQKRIAEILKESECIDGKQTDLLMTIITENHDNQIPAAYLSDSFYALDYHQLKKALDPTAAYYNSPQLEKAKKYLANLEKRAPGTMFKDFEMNDTDGKAHKLSEWCGKGKYVLVDFWASWCGPCRMEMPNVVENYNKYKDKGFDVVGVSFDKDGNAWKSAIQSLNMPWHHISDLKGWQSLATSVYGIQSIPANVLLNPQGKIIAIDLRGKDLGKKLEEIF